MTRRTNSTLSRIISCIMVAVALIVLATPVCAQDGVSEQCPNGHRTVENPTALHENGARTDLSCPNLSRADFADADLAWAWPFQADSLLLPSESPNRADIQGLQVDLQRQILDAQRGVASRPEAVPNHMKFAIYFSGAVIIATLVFLLLTGSFGG